MAFLGAQVPLYALVLINILILQCHTVKPQFPPPHGETLSFGFTRFDDDNPNVVPEADASFSGGVIQLTKTGLFGIPLEHSVGRAVHITPVHLWDKATGALADFTTAFSFVVNRLTGSTQHGDGFAFFIAPAHIQFPKNSSGGYLGLFSPEPYLPSPSEILAVEFDSFTNEWDPDFPLQLPHIGIDVNSVKSVATEFWPIDAEPANAVGHVNINYNSESKRLSVSLAYSGNNRTSSVTTLVDLRNVLPEWVRVGFSAATGELVETHEILTWGFEASL